MSKGSYKKTEAIPQSPPKKEIQVLEVGVAINKFGKTGTIIWMGIQNDVTNVKVRWNDGTVAFFEEKDLQ